MNHGSNSPTQCSGEMRRGARTLCNYNHIMCQKRQHGFMGSRSGQCCGGSGRSQVRIRTEAPFLVEAEVFIWWRPKNPCWLTTYLVSGRRHCSGALSITLDCSIIWFRQQCENHLACNSTYRHFAILCELILYIFFPQVTNQKLHMWLWVVKLLSKFMQDRV